MLDNQIDCGLENKGVYGDIPASQTVVIIAVGKNEKAYLEFTYHLKDIYSLDFIMTALGIAAMTLACCVGCYILFILRTTTAVKI